MSITKFPNGVSSYGMPLVGMTTGSVFFVDDSGSNSNSGTDPDNPFADVDYAYGRCTAGLGDIVYLMPGHAETLNTALTMDLADVSVIGLGIGAQKPVLTLASAASDGVSVTGARNNLMNVRMLAVASSTAFINVAGPDFNAEKVTMDGVAIPLNFVTIAALGQRFRFSECLFRSTTDGPNNGILIEVPDMAGWIVEDCDFNFAVAGLDEAAIVCSFQNPGGRISRNHFMGMDAVAIDFNSSVGAVTEGMINDNRMTFATSIANIDGAIDAGGYGLLENYAIDLPTETAGVVPVTSAA